MTTRGDRRVQIYGAVHEEIMKARIASWNNTKSIETDEIFSKLLLSAPQKAIECI